MATFFETINQTTAGAQGGSSAFEALKAKAASRAAAPSNLGIRPIAEPEQRSFFGKAAEFLAPTATRTFGKLSTGEDLTARDILGSALEIGSFLVPVGAVGRGVGLAAKGLGLATKGLGKRALEFGAVGAATGGLAEAGRAVGEGEDIGGIASRTLTGAAVGAPLGAALPLAARGAGKVITGVKSKAAAALLPPTEEQATRAAGTIFQGRTKEAQAGLKVLSKIDTKGVSTYEDLSSVLETNIKNRLAKVDAAFQASSQPIPLKNLAKEVTADFNGRKLSAKVNYVKESLDQLAELYRKTRNPTDQLRIKALTAKARSQGLTPFEINSVAREYGTDFGKKAFNKMGDPLTSVNAVAFENTRKGIKEAARSLLTDDATRQLDKEASELIRTRALADKMREAVNKLEQRVQERGFIEQISRGAAKIADIATFGGPKAFVTKLFFPSNVGLKTMNALDLQQQLAKNLKLIREFQGASDGVLKNKLLNLAKQAGMVKSSTVFGRRPTVK